MTIPSRVEVRHWKQSLGAHSGAWTVPKVGQLLIVLHPDTEVDW